MMQNERNYLLFLLSKQEYAYAELKYKLKARGHLCDDEINVSSPNSRELAYFQSQTTMS